VRPSAHAQRARIRAALGDLPGAYADLARAAELYPARSAYARESEVLGRRLAVSTRSSHEAGLGAVVLALASTAFEGGGSPDGILLVHGH
jgi:hypothetical protein